MRRWWLAAALVVVWSSADAQQPPPPSAPCKKSWDLAESLRLRYKEFPIAAAKVHNGSILQVYQSEEKDTWTAVAVYPNGYSCIVAVGKKWRALDPVDKDPMA